MNNEASIEETVGQDIWVWLKEFVTVTGGHHSDLWRSDTLPRLWRFIDRHGTR